MNLRKICPFLLVIVLAISVAGCAGGGSGTASSSSAPPAGMASNPSSVTPSTTANTQKIAISHTNSNSSPWEIASLRFAEVINGNSDGAFTVETYPSGQLCQNNWEIMLEMVQTGSTQIGIEALTALGSLNPDVSLINLPFLFQDIDHVYNYLNSGDPVWESFMKAFEDSNIVILGVAPRPMRQLNNNLRLVKTPEDIRGMKFRVPGNPLFVSIFEAIGAKPVPMAIGEVYSAIQLGTVNGEDNSVQTQYDFKTYEVAKYFTMWNYAADGSVIFMNKDFYYGATDEQRQLFHDAAAEWVKTNMAEDKAYFDVAYKVMEESGVEFYTMTEEEKEPFKELLKPVYEQYEAKDPNVYKGFMEGVAAAAK